MGFLLDALLGHRAAKGQNPDERISPLAVAPVEVPTFMEYRFFDGHYKDEYQIPRAAPGQEELFFTGGLRQSCLYVLSPADEGDEQGSETPG